MLWCDLSAHTKHQSVPLSPSLSFTHTDTHTTTINCAKLLMKNIDQAAVIEQQCPFKYFHGCCGRDNFVRRHRKGSEELAKVLQVVLSSLVSRSHAALLCCSVFSPSFLCLRVRSVRGCSDPHDGRQDFKQAWFSYDQTIDDRELVEVLIASCYPMYTTRCTMKAKLGPITKTVAWLKDSAQN